MVSLQCDGVPPSAGSRRRDSAVDDRHIAFVVALTCGRRKVVQPFDLLGTQHDAIGGGAVPENHAKIRLSPASTDKISIALYDEISGKFLFQCDRVQRQR